MVKEGVLNKDLNAYSLCSLFAAFPLLFRSFALFPFPRPSALSAILPLWCTGISGSAIGPLLAGDRIVGRGTVLP